MKQTTNVRKLLAGAEDYKAARKRKEVLKSEEEGRCEGGDDDIEDGVNTSDVDASSTALT